VLDTDSETVRFIKQIIETRIRPFVQEDGGDAVFIGFDEAGGVLQIALRGSCTGCPSSEVTLKQGIEKMLKYYVAEVSEVVAVDESELQEVIGETPADPLQSASPSHLPDK